MTVTSQLSIQQYFGDGLSTLFAIPFYWISNAHIRVLLIETLVPLNEVAWVEGTDYTLTGEGSLSGGFLTAFVAPPLNFTLRIERIVPILQLDNWIAHDTFNSETAERDWDYLTMICQQMQQGILTLTNGGTQTFMNIGGVGGNVYAGTVGNVVQLKRITGGGSTIVTETASLITVSSSASGIDTSLDYAWTGHHTWDKQAHRTLPSHTMKSLQGGVDITDTGILLANDFVAMLDMRMRTDVSLDGPVDASEGGNFGIYIQHAIAGTAGGDGFAGGGIRAQVETQAVRTFSSPGAVSGYFGINNLGTDQGAFGVHVDAYHSGTFAGFSHSTYGFSAEVFKNVAGGIAAGTVIRSNASQPVDFGAIIVHTTGAAGLKRGIQLGSPLIANGGIPGGTGALTPFTVGIDLTWGSYSAAALMVKANDYIYLGGQAQAQTATPINQCNMRWNNVNGNFELTNISTIRFEVNLSNGRMRQNNNDAISMFDTTTNWVFACATTGGKNSNTATAGGAGGVPATVRTYIHVIVDGFSLRIPCFNP